MKTRRENDENSDGYNRSEIFLLCKLDYFRGRRAVNELN